MRELFSKLYSLSKWKSISLVLGFVALVFWRHWLAIILVFVIVAYIAIINRFGKLKGLLIFGVGMVIGYNIFVAPIFERPEVEGKSLGEKIMYVIDGYNEGFDELFFEIVPNVLKDELIVPIYNDTKELGRDLMNVEPVSNGEQ